MVINFNPSDLPSDKNVCTPFPMPTMSGLHVGAAVQVIQPEPAIICQPKKNPLPTPLPQPTPANLSPTPHPALTRTRRPAPTRQVRRLERPALDWRVSGPFPQTLFLGCSVIDFNVSLGWGSQDGSTLTVNLIRDPMPTFTMSPVSIGDRSSRYDGIDFAALEAAAKSVAKTPNHYYNSMKPPKALVESLQNSLAALPANYTEEQYRAVMDAHTWSPPDPFKDINGNPIIPGKLYYEYDIANKTYIQKYWLGPDPGFIGDKDYSFDDLRVPIYSNEFDYQGLKGWGINIIGAPVRFVVDEFIFCGVVTDWRKSISSGGTQYSVTIQTPAYLLRNAKLILGHYAGTVFTKDAALPVVAPAPRMDFDGSIPLTPWETYYQQAYPAAFNSFSKVYKNYLSGPTNITDMLVGDQIKLNKFYGTSWQGNIKNDGNLPNVINMYGFLESLGPGFFGGARLNDMGIKYNTLIGTLGAMLSTPAPSPFNPFGGLLGTSMEPPFYKPPSNPANPEVPPRDHVWADVFTDNDCPTVTDTVKVPNNATALANVAGAGDTALQRRPATYITKYTGPTAKIWDFGFISPKLCFSSLTYKQKYYLDLSELPVLPDLLRYDVNSTPVASIAEFIDDVCDKAGCEYFWEMLNLPSNGIGLGGTIENFNILKIRTVSRKNQPSDTAIENYLRGFVGSKTQVDYGKEFNADAKTRVMYIGGKQKRLIQVKNFRLGKSQSVHIYSPITKRFVILDTKEKNKIRIPNAASTRHPLNLIRGAENTNLNEVGTPGIFFSNDQNWWQTNYDGGAAPSVGQAPTNNPSPSDAQDENPAVQRAEPNQPGVVYKPARYRAGKSATSESTITFVGNYFGSTHLAFNRFKDITVFKTRLAANEAASGKITQSQTIQKRIDSAYDKVAALTISAAQLAVNTVTKWFGMRTINLSWANKGDTPILTNVYDRGNQTEIGVQSKKNKTKIAEKIITINRFFPLMHDVICPYFGSINYLPTDALGNVYNNAGYIKTPRPVWYDMWTNQIVIVFNVNDLPRTRMLLRGTYANGTSFVVTESELRAALNGHPSWMAYLSGKLFKPDIVHMIKAFLCPITVPPAAGDPASQRGTAQGDPDRRNDPANAQQTTTVDNDGGAASSVPTPTSTFDLDGTNECDYCKIFESLFGVPRINVMNGSVSHAAPPINLKAGLAAAFHDDLLILHSFFQRIAQEFYGKQFMVKLPMVRTYLDRNVYIIDEGYSSSLLFNNGTMRIMEGDGKIYSNYKISPQGAWEEAGNMIDDQIVIGGWYSNIFQNDQGLIEPILGFWSSMGFDYESYFICRLLQENNGQRVDPERSKGALFKIGDMVHAPRVCIDTIAGTSSTDTTDGSPLTPAPDPRTKPLRHGSDNHETPGT